MPPVVHEALRSPGRPLDEGSRAFMEGRFGRDFSGVRVHTDAQAGESAEAVDATAYTSGRDVVFGPGQFAPSTQEGRRLLAHELTHVAQQEGNHRSLSSTGSAEAEARSNGLAVLAGSQARVASGAPAGALQREEKKPSGSLTTESGFEKKEDKATNKFAYEASVKIPLLNGRLGPFSFLEDLKLKNKGSKESEEPIPTSFTGLSSLQTSAALKLVSFEVPPLTLPKSLGQLSLEGSLATSGSLKQSFDPAGPSSQDLSATASLEGGYKSSPLLSPQYGKLTLGATLGGTGTVKQKYGGKSPGFAPSASGSLGFEASYLSRPTTSGLVNLGGILGDRASLSLTAKSGLEAAVDTDAGASLKPSGSVELGLTGQKRRGVEPFLKLKVAGEAEIDLKTGGIKDSSKSISAGITTGVNF